MGSKKLNPSESENLISPSKAADKNTKSTANLEQGFTQAAAEKTEQ